MIIKKESKRYPGLFVKKYHRKVFFKNLWHTNPDLLEARGHVEDSDGNTVINPFTKIFNYGENGTTIHRDTLCLAVEKINGFMLAVTYVPAVDDVVISTTGSLDSKFVDMGAGFISDNFKYSIKSRAYNGSTATHLFEIVHPDDPHIIKEDVGAYYLGSRNITDKRSYKQDLFDQYTFDSIAKMFGFRRPKYFVGLFSDIVKVAKESKREGYVVYDLYTGKSLKIKSPYYLATKAIARIKDIGKLDKKRVDEEFYDLVDYMSEFTDLTEQQRIAKIEEYYG